jgi:hypothetical protein
MTNITSSQVSDTQLALLIEMASAQLNADIAIKHEDERVQYIDEVKTNDIDGATLTYYSKNYPIGDRNNSYKLTTSDVHAYVIDADNNKNLQTVTSITADEGKFVLSRAPLATEELYITYYSTNVLTDPPHRLVKLATIWLTAAFAYSKINIGKAPRFKEGPLTVFRDTTAHKEYMSRYYEAVYKITKITKSEEHELTL